MKTDLISHRSEHLASLAEHAANGGSNREWARLKGFSAGYASKLWAIIKADLGEQAR